MNTDFDVIVIGAGPAGYTAAERAGARGRRVLLIEKDQPGGLCLNAGCIPSKTLLFSAKLYAQMQQGARYGVHAADLRFQLAEVIARKERLVQQLRDGVLYLMHRRSVTVVSGEAELLDRQTVRVQSTDYRAPALILAAGSSHVRPDIPGIDLPHVLNTTQMLDMTTMPTGLVILGSDGIGMGFATSFGLAGVPVTVIEAGPEILPALDAELAALLRKEMPYVTFITAAQVERIT
nr:FAD-dependent oxidoreductase [Anaerolineae bacterium]